MGYEFAIAQRNERIPTLSENAKELTSEPQQAQQHAQCLRLVRVFDWFDIGFIRFEEGFKSIKSIFLGSCLVNQQIKSVSCLA